MGSSPIPEPVVEASPIARKREVAKRGGPRHSAAVLLIDVVRLLRGRGLPVVEAHAYNSEALRAAGELLRCVGIEVDPSATRRPVAHGPAHVAAATLMRAAGIEPNEVVTWPNPADQPARERPSAQPPAVPRQDKDAR